VRAAGVAILAVFTLAAAAAQASGARADGRVLFVVATGTGSARHAYIVGVDPATGRTSALARAAIDTENPAASRDGRRLAFTRGYEEGGPATGLYVADADGKHAKRIAPIGFSPTWSPDGSRLAYVRHGDVVILRMNVRSVRRLRLTHVWQVAWSPRGGQLLISRGATAPSLQLVRTDGSGLRTIARATKGEAFLNPAWAPDGRQIAYEHDLGCVGEKCGGGIGIEIADLRHHVSKTIAGFYPSWSPSGRSLAYATAGGVFVRSLTDGSTRQLFAGTLETTGITWQAR